MEILLHGYNYDTQSSYDLEQVIHILIYIYIYISIYIYVWKRHWLAQEFEKENI